MTNTTTNHEQEERLASRPYSLNPGDEHLQIILTRRAHGAGYVTHVYNADFGERSGGHYFGDEAAAWRDFLTRGPLGASVPETAETAETAVLA